MEDRSRFCSEVTTSAGESEAQRLLEQHRRLFSRFWAWLDLTVSAGIEQGHMTTKLGWVRQILPASARSNGDRKDQLKSLQNYLMQATGAELMRLAMIKATERGLMVCAAVHDGLLLECAAEDARQAPEDMVACMHEASRTLLGTEIPVETKAPIFHPDHFIPDKPEALKMWALVRELLEALEHPQPSPEFRLTPGPQVATL
jgi:DNA polymerase I